ncbi:MAG: helix-turn-helix transcriptional regulator [Clostridia bacterium]|nr:helix-turn-helix transcriptional regulator [Clostridia bacterium]
MLKKDTHDIQNDLMKYESLNSFLSDNKELFVSETMVEILNSIFEKKDITKSVLAKRAEMSEIYLHQIFAGKRNPSRNRLICLCYGLETTLEETQELLKCSGCAQLYPKIKRDAIIIYGLLHSVPLFEINDKLFAENEETLY